MLRLPFLLWYACDAWEEFAWDAHGLVPASDAELLDLAFIGFAELVDLLTAKGIEAAHAICNVCEAKLLDEIVVRADLGALDRYMRVSSDVSIGQEGNV